MAKATVDSFMVVVRDNIDAITGGRKADRDAARSAIVAAYRNVSGFHRSDARSDALTYAATEKSSRAGALAAILTDAQAMVAEKATRRVDPSEKPGFVLAAVTDLYRSVVAAIDASDDSDTIVHYAETVLAIDTDSDKLSDADQDRADVLRAMVGKLTDAATVTGTKTRRPADALQQLFDADILKPGMTLTTGGKHSGATATVRKLDDDGLSCVALKKGGDVMSLTAAGNAVRGVDVGTNGWTFWRLDGDTLATVWRNFVAD